MRSRRPAPRGGWAAVGAIAAVALTGACGGDGPGGGLTDGGTPDVPSMDAGRDYTPEPFTPTEATRAYCAGWPERDVVAIEERITAALATLSVTEKVRMIAGAGLALSDGTWAVPGDERLAFPGLHMLDGPRGLSRFRGLNGTAFPVAMMRGATWDPQLERRVGAAMAREHWSAGADVILAPTINVLRHPRWGRAQETYSEDTVHLGALGVAFIQGVQSEGVIASAKHYAANSIEDTRHTVDVQVDERTLREVYLPHFRRAVQEAQVGSVMSAYNRVNGLYCDLHTHLLTDVLKGEWQFQGFVESDWILGTHGDVASLRAGLDLEMPSPAHFRRLPALAAEDPAVERDVDRALRRVLRAQLCFGLDERRRPRDEPGVRESEAHRALAREVATRGAVLLRNEGGALPLGLDERVVLVGPLADVENIGDTGSSDVAPSDVVTLREGLEATSTQVTTLTTLDAGGEALVAAADAVVVAVGLTADDEGEATIGAGDRSDLALPATHRALVERVAALNPRVIVVLEGGSAIVVDEWIDRVQAVVHAFYPGQEGGLALADLLYARRNFSGRLPFSVPRAEADLPPFDNTSEQVVYGYLHGYRHLDATGTPPRFPFGHGLSYTTFAYDAPTLSARELTEDAELDVRVRVTNTGTMAGVETPQIYLGAVTSSVLRAPRDLRAFAQVELDPGASEEVAFTIPIADLAYWDPDARRWVVEPTEYELWVAASAGELRHAARFRVR